MNRRTPRWVKILESLVVFAFGASLMTFAYPGGRDEDQDDVGVPGHDSFYHVKMSAMIPEVGLVHEFPWLRFAYFTEEGHGFVSHHYGFHLLLLPFVTVSHYLTGDYLAGGRWAIATFFGLFALLYHWHLCECGVRRRGLWLLLLPFLPAHFYTRHAFIRAICPSLVFMLLILLLMFRRRYAWVGLVIAAYIHVYLGGVLYAPLLIIAYVICSLVGVKEDREIPWRLILWSLGGWVIGILTHPYRSGVFEFLRLQVFGSGLTPDISVGREWNPYNNTWWFANAVGVPLTIWAVAVCMRMRLGLRLNAKELTWVLLHFGFLVLTAKARRFIEYWPIFGLLSSAYLLAPITRQWADEQAKTESEPVTGFLNRVAQFIPLLLAVTTVIVLALIAPNRQDVAVVLRKWPIWTILLAAYLCVPLWTLWSHRRGSRSQNLLSSVNLVTAAVALCVMTATLMALPWKEIEKTNRCNYDLPAIRSMATWFKENSEPGDVIFTDDWDVFPVYFYHNSHNHYIVGLDPKFTHHRRPELWERYVKISRGQVPTDTQVEVRGEDGRTVSRAIHVRLEDIREHFGARFVIVDQDHRALGNKLAVAKHLAQMVYPTTTYAKASDAPFVVFRIRDESEAVRPEIEGDLADVDSAGALHLSLLPPESVHQAWGDFQVNRSVSGSPIMMRGKTYTHGLGTHAASRVQYRLPSGFDRFEATMGIDDDTEGRGSIIASIWIDGRRVYQSPLLTGAADPEQVSIPLRDAKMLVLQADTTDDGNKFDHVDWAEARLVRLTRNRTDNTADDVGGAQPAN